LREINTPLLIGWGHKDVPEHEELPPHLRIYYAEDQDDPEASPLIAQWMDPTESVTAANTLVDGAEPYEYQ
jgi:hypothetical protein